MIIISVVLVSFWMFSSVIMNNIALAIDSTEVRHIMSLSSREKENDNEIIILFGATLIDGTGSPPKSDTVVIINGSKIGFCNVSVGS